MSCTPELFNPRGMITQKNLRGYKILFFFKIQIMLPVSDGGAAAAQVVQHEQQLTHNPARLSFVHPPAAADQVRQCAAIF